MGDQLFGMDLAIFDHLGGNSEGRTASIGANWPGFHAMTKSTGEVNFLVPDRGGVDAHGVQADANDYNRSACTRPAYRVMNRLLTANGVVDYIVATDQHFVAEHAGVELRSCCSCSSISSLQPPPIGSGPESELPRSHKL